MSKAGCDLPDGPFARESPREIAGIANLAPLGRRPEWRRRDGARFAGAVQPQPAAVPPARAAARVSASPLSR
jgi:hypothetical protein